MLSQTCDLWTDEATVVRRVREEKDKRESREKRVEKSQNTVCFQCFGAQEGRTSRPTGAEASDRMRDQQLLCRSGAKDISKPKC